MVNPYDVTIATRYEDTLPALAYSRFRWLAHASIGYPCGRCGQVPAFDCVTVGGRHQGRITLTHHAERIALARRDDPRTRLTRVRDMYLVREFPENSPGAAYVRRLNQILGAWDEMSPVREDL